MVLQKIVLVPLHMRSQKEKQIIVRELNVLHFSVTLYLHFLLSRTWNPFISSQTYNVNIFIGLNCMLSLLYM